MAAAVGVIHEPEITSKILSIEDRFLVIGSDGLFEHLSNQQIIDIVGAAIKARTLSM